MKKFFHRVGGGFAASLIAVTALVLGGLTIPPSFGPRQFPSQQTHYLRVPVTFNSCVVAALTCSYKVDALPYNAYLLRADMQVYTAFTGNGATTATVSLGTTATPTTEIMAAASVFAATAGVAQTVVAGNRGDVVTGNTATQTGALGGFDVYARLTYGTAVPTQGNAVLILEYVAPNDGACSYTAQGATAPGC
jgi:hypothetical protein